MMFHFSVRCVLACLSLTGAAALTGCGASPSEHEAGRVGTVSAALATTGADGAVYRFPSGSVLNVQSSTFTQVIPIDSPEPTISLSLPVGSFTASLSPSPLQLEKTLAGTTTLVNATLLNTQPLTFDVVENQTTPLDLRFRVEGLRDITFSAGRMLVTLNVAKGEVDSASRALAQGTTTISEVTFGEIASPDAQSLLAVNAGEAFPFGLVFATSGAWRLTGAGRACIGAQLTSVSFPGGTGFAQRMSQVLNGTGDFCVLDFGATDAIEVRVDNGVTPQFQQAILTSNYDFFLSLTAPLAGDIFDGLHLRQSALETISPSNGGSFVLGAFDLEAGTSLTQIQGDFTGQVQASP